MRAKAAIAAGLVLQLIMPWGFVATGRAVWRIAMAPPTADVLRLYAEVLAATRYLAISACVSQAGLHLVAWAATGAGRPRTNAARAPSIPEK